MTPPTRQMRQEIRDIPAAAQRLLDEGRAPLEAAAAALAERDPAFLVTVARGTSDHACSFLKYAIEIETGRPVASVGPSIASVYRAPLKLAGGACLAVSQSGQSPDIVELASAARRGGALSLALTNTADSPLARASDHAVDILAGPELAVAATKTFVNSVLAGLMILARWTGNAALDAALLRLPEALETAVAETWPGFREAVAEAPALFVLGRGPCYAIAQEAALKFKEVVQIQAESYSSAEVMHGPVALVGEGYPVLCLAAGDAAAPGLAEVADRLAGMGGQVFATTGLVREAVALPHVETGHPLTDGVARIASFYAMVEALAEMRGTDPDAPRNLRKVTETV
ncbi:SIS domain-containing protein [Poseidonocella sp. HB161398]|uniref:SIS domain-containing protein n=1 Tax=Poseidonocella sp. HB161398 TaxID=2320855 RepID=UPI0011080B3F|nr:SIS domain-containing protein [Poseidonocella sp. HB161398]